MEAMSAFGMRHMLLWASQREFVPNSTESSNRPLTFLPYQQYRHLRDLLCGLDIHTTEAQTLPHSL